MKKSSSTSRSTMRKSALASLTRKREQERARNNNKPFTPYAESNEGKDNSAGRAREAMEIRKRRETADAIRNQYVPLVAARPKKQAPFEKVRVPGQNFFLVHIAQRHVRPRSMKPMVRIMGAFDTYEDAQYHADTCLKKYFKNWDLHCFKQGQKFALMSTYEGFAPQRMELKIADIERAYGIEGPDTAYNRYKHWAKEALVGRGGDEAEEEEDEEEEEVDERIKKAQQRIEERRRRDIESLEKSVTRLERKATQVANERTARVAAIESKLKEECKTEDNKIRTETQRVPTVCMLHDQRFAAISTLKDITPEAIRGEVPEPMIILWGVFKTLEEARAWVPKGQTHVLDYNIDIVDMYEPLFIQHVDSEKIETIYRNEHQNEIMGSIERGHRNVSDFTEFCEEEDLEVPTTDIEILDNGRQVIVTKTGLGISKTSVQVAKEIIDKDLPTDNAKLETDPLYIPPKEARKRLAKHEEAWKQVPECPVVDTVTDKILYGPGAGETRPSKAPETENDAASGKPGRGPGEGETRPSNDLKTEQQ